MADEPTHAHVDTGKFVREQPWLADLLYPVYEKMKDAEAKYEAAMRQAEEARTKMVMHASQFATLVNLAKTMNFSADEVERYCQHVLQRKELEASLPPEALGKRRVSNAELMVAVARAIKNAERPMNIDEILAAIEAASIYLPGKEPRKNLLAYISRSPLIRTVKKGLYSYDPELLQAAEANFGARTHDPKGSGPAP